MLTDTTVSKSDLCWDSLLYLQASQTQRLAYTLDTAGGVLFPETRLGMQPHPAATRPPRERVCSLRAFVWFKQLPGVELLFATRRWQPER